MERIDIILYTYASWMLSRSSLQQRLVPPVPRRRLAPPLPNPFPSLPPTDIGLATRLPATIVPLWIVLVVSSSKTSFELFCAGDD